MPSLAGWRVGDRATGHLGISCWVSYIDGAASLRLLRQRSKARMASVELGTKGMASILETSLRSPAEGKDWVRLLLSGWSAGNKHDLEVGGFSLCKKKSSLQAKRAISALKSAVRRSNSLGEPRGCLSGVRRYYAMHLNHLTDLTVCEAELESLHPGLSRWGILTGMQK